jgi:hypothetical protein
VVRRHSVWRTTLSGAPRRFYARTVLGDVARCPEGTLTKRIILTDTSSHSHTSDSHMTKFSNTLSQQTHATLQVICTHLTRTSRTRKHSLATHSHSNLNPTQPTVNPKHTLTTPSHSSVLQYSMTQLAPPRLFGVQHHIYSIIELKSKQLNQNLNLLNQKLYLKLKPKTAPKH